VNTRAAVLVCVGLLAARSLAAQVDARFGVDGSLARVRFRSTARGGGEALGGALVGGEGRVVVGRLALKLSYAQGRLSGDAGTPLARELVDGKVLLAARPVDWLTVAVGPHLRAYVLPGATERWTLWESHVRGESTIIPGVLGASLEGWLALSSSVNVYPGAAGARGGAAGLTLQLGRSAFWASLRYVVDRADVGGGVRAETLESVVVAVALGRP
jgi:hypothetical protein